MSRTTDLVVTTIWEPAWLRGYLDDIEAAGRKDRTTLRIICDRKTPPTVQAEAAAARRAGFRVDCPSLDEQEQYLRKLGVAHDFIPWDSDNRRNIGFLRAWESGAEVVISIDDDNYCEPGTNFVGNHQCVGRPVDGADAHVAEGPWFNICSRLDTNGAAIWPRGFPYAARTPGAPAQLRVPTAADRSRIIAVNAGLWTDDPDVDAITRLAVAPRAISAQPAPVMLGETCWTPINTQNTGLMRDALPAYYYVRMGHPLHGMKIDRFGDILSGYFVQKCAKHLGHAVRIGEPVARHRRTPHNLFVDLFHELAGIVIVEELVPWLRDVRLEGGTYAAAYGSLAEALRGMAGHRRGFIWDQGGRDFLHETAARMQTWLSVLERLR